MNPIRQKWLDALGTPSCAMPNSALTWLTGFSHAEFDAELYRQENGAGTHQRVMMVFPKKLTKAAPAVVVPFYFPEAMLGFEPATGEMLPSYEGVEMMLHLVRRGYVAACADAYHLTYIESNKERRDFSRWQDAADALRHDHPHWSGIGKLVQDTTLLLDAVAEDARVDATRIGIAGHSLGGKMAFYTGCLDDRIRVILASDFGIGWEQSNWRDDWYWGKDVEHLIDSGMDHAELLSSAAPKPFCLIAGKYDNETSGEMMRRAKGYAPDDARLKFVNHATGHRPPMWALEEGYDFLDRWLK
ncbi:MAG: acetylxylan esterase [Clostridia bacterium]|nr:acetylxylan esterase [Clostridia bacterium]